MIPDEINRRLRGGRAGVDEVATLESEVPGERGEMTPERNEGGYTDVDLKAMRIK